jgi:hypothetical protein
VNVKRFLFVAVAMVCLLVGRQTGMAQDAGINGKWHFVLTTPGGDREMDADFTVDADGKVTGKFGSSDVAGTFKDGQLDLNFEMTSEEAGVTAQMKISSKVEAGSPLSGNWEFSSYSGTFTADRPKPPQP